MKKQTIKPQKTKCSRWCRTARKLILTAMICSVYTTVFPDNIYADGSGVVDTSTFITTSCTVLKSVICLIGGGVGIWGIVNLLEGYGNDNSGAKAP